MPSSHTPRRVVSLQPSATVTLAAVGELDRVVACTKYCADVVPEITLRPPLILTSSSPLCLSRRRQASKYLSGEAASWAFRQRLSLIFIRTSLSSPVPS